MRLRGAAAAAAALTMITLTACSDAEPLALREPVEVEVGETTMAFAVDDVREGSVADLVEQGVSTGGIEGRGVYFVTYSIGLVSGDIADADSGELPVPATDEWDLDGEGSYEPLQVIGSYDCTLEGNATAGVGPDAPLVGCQAFLGQPDALPTGVTTDLGTWTTD